MRMRTKHIESDQASKRSCGVLFEGVCETMSFEKSRAVGDIADPQLEVAAQNFWLQEGLLRLIVIKTGFSHSLFCLATVRLYPKIYYA